MNSRYVVLIVTLIGGTLAGAEVTKAGEAAGKGRVTLNSAVPPAPPAPGGPAETEVGEVGQFMAVFSKGLKAKGIVADPVAVSALSQRIRIRLAESQRNLPPGKERQDRITEALQKLETTLAAALEKFQGTRLTKDHVTGICDWLGPCWPVCP
ncbi:MAG TPA: hypothetical protein VD994_18210 [Prosthecobacter sp.]|nr:hypothetical protein [Prosthecobacter sp.]